MKSFGMIFLEKEKETEIERYFITYPKKELRMSKIDIHG